MAKRQGPNDRLDESLGMRDGKESTKSQSYASRRHESRGARKHKQTSAAANSAAMKGVSSSTAVRVSHQSTRTVPSVPSGGGNAASIASATMSHEKAAAKGALGHAYKYAMAQKNARRGG